MNKLNESIGIKYEGEISKLIELWENVFKHEVSPEEDFYSIGGNSLIMMRIIKKIDEIFHLKISPMKFIELSNIINIYQFIVKNRNNSNEERLFPLSSIQEAYYIGRNKEYMMGGISTHTYFEVETEFDIKKLTDSLNILINKQPSLRTIFIDEDNQKIMENVEKYHIEYEDCYGFSRDMVEHRIIDIREELSKTVLSPNIWPLFKIKALTNIQGKTLLFIHIDLLIMDGASIGLFMRQWKDICEDNDITDVRFDFFKYRIQEKEDKNTVEYLEDEKYWKNISSEIPEKPNLNLKNKIEHVKKINNKRLSREINLDLFNKICTQASKRNISISVALCTAYSYILGHWSNQNKLSINVTSMNRPVYDGVDEVIGEFTKILILDASLSIGKSFWENCCLIQTKLLQGLSHQNYDGVELIRELSKTRDLQEDIAMPIVFTSMLFSERRNNIDSLGKILYSISQTSQVYLDSQISYTSDGVLINWDYVEELFDESMINQMFNQYISLIESLAGENVVYPSLSDRDNSLVKSYNETEEDIPSTTVQDEFSKIVEKYPDKVIVKDKNGGITCKELDEKSAQICNFLLEKGIQQGDVVAVLGERKKETIINILGILKSGAAYVAIDPNHPLERQKYILKNSGSSLYIDRDFYERNSISNYSSANPQIEYDPSELAYIIYTSGSTGKPKGVAITHEAAMNTVIDINRKFSVDKEDKIIGLSSMCFDLSVYDIFGSLTTGATLVEIPDIHDMYYVSEIIEQEGITIWNSVPAVMDMLVSNNEIQNKDLEIDLDDIIDVKLEESSLRLVLLSGDWIPVSLPERIKEQYENAEVISLGGATEASIWSIYYPIDKVDASWKSIPYGKPLANQEYYVLNYDLEDCPVGVAGELYIGGKGLAREYYRDEEKTKSAFINHSKYGRLYKTGDYGVMNRDGNIIFLGRKDYQVKIGGHRIELGEIENQLMKYEKVSNCAVVDWENDDGQKYLCAYIVSNEDFESEEMSKFLSLSLPEYMVPRYYERTDSIPVNINGKVDKKKLLRPEIEAEKNIILPRTDMEKNISRIWEDVLNISPISVKDSFMNLGGDSIKMVKVLSKMTELLGLKISFKEFVKENNIEKLSYLLEKKTSNLNKNIYLYKNHNLEDEYEEFPLTDVQMAYLLGRDEEFSLGGVSTHGYYEIVTKLDIEQLEINLNRLILEQSMLRTVINDKGNQQILKKIPYYKINMMDLTNFDAKEINKKIMNERNRMSHYIFDVNKWPLFEFKAFKISESEYYLFIGIDLLIADGSSMRILVKGLLDNDIKTSTNLFNYKDYVEALEDFKNSETYSDDKKYWENKILSLPSSPGLPLKGSINEIIKPYFKRCESVVGNELWTKIKSISRREGITVSSLLYSAYAYILGYWSNQPELTVNVTVFTRYPFNENVNNIIGDFTSVILVDSDVKNVTNFWDFAKKSQENMLEALEHRHYDGINVIREIKKQKGLQNQAIMPVVFTSLLFSMDEEDNSTINDLGEIKMGVSQTSQVYLDYQVMETKEGLSVTWDYVEELFDESMINQMFNQYISLIESLAGENVVYPSLSDRDNSLVKSYNETEEDIPSTTVQDEFSKIVEKYPDKVIVKDKNGGITCKELDEKSAQICNFLLEKGIQQGDVVAVLGERKKETIINILGILKSGAAYVAIDPNHPLERQKYILKNSGSSLYIDRDFYERNSISNYSSANPQIEYDPSELAYIIYTSGSTGKPKGVAITHEAAMNTVIDINRKFSVDKEDKIIGLSSMCFDLSVYDIFGSLTTGATLVEIPDIHDMYYVSEIIEQEGITIWNSVPAVMDMLVSNNEIQNKDLEIDLDDIIDVKLEESSLRLVLLSGDWIPVSLPERIKEQYENAEVISLGGATEASIWSIYYPIDKVDASWKSIPYGKPLANQEYYVLNYDLEDCPVGVAGELYIGGKGLAREYYRDEEKTKSAFINHSKYGRLYKTGDYGVMNRDGNIIFLGRKDYQVKIGGHRIELGEIENQLMKYEKVSNCAVVDWENDDGQKYLCAYIVSNEDFESEEMSKFLSLSLPEYMVPRYYERTDSIPVNINGKVDKKKLLKPERTINCEIFKPETKKEREIIDIWSEILHISNINRYDDFFKIGGDSISALKVYAQLIKKYQVNVQDLYRYRNANSLSRILKKKDAKIYFENLKKEFEEKEQLLINPNDSVLNEYKKYLDEIDIYRKIDISDKNSYKNVLIIGGTGFLGSHILYEFLKNTESNVYLLVRGDDEETARKRILETLIYFDNYNERWFDKINIIIGDITKHQFGISNDEFMDLAQKIDCIFNSAAIVSHLGLYETMYKTNVEGCKNVLEFAKESKNAKIFHISTKHVGFGEIENTKQVLFCENDFDRGQKIYNNYSKTKYEAEELMILARKEGLDVTIFRMGNISCEYETGKFQKNIEESAFYILTRSFLRIGIVPISYQKTVDLTYVDEAAHAIFLLSMVKELKNETFHIENTELISFAEFGKYLKIMGESIELKEYNTMMDYVYKKYTDDEDSEMITEINNLIAYIEFLPWHTGTLFNFVKDKTKLILDKLDFHWQKPDKIMIEKLIKHGKKVGFLD